MVSAAKQDKAQSGRERLQSLCATSSMDGSAGRCDGWPFTARRRYAHIPLQKGRVSNAYLTRNNAYPGSAWHCLPTVTVNRHVTEGITTVLDWSCMPPLPSLLRFHSAGLTWCKPALKPYVSHPDSPAHSGHIKGSNSVITVTIRGPNAHSTEAQESHPAHRYAEHSKRSQ
jgi:hypothetical protein